MGTENRTNRIDMKLLRLLAILLAIVALSCKPEELPDGNNKENTENTDDTGNGDDDGPSRPIRPDGDKENGDENDNSGNDDGNDNEPTVPEQPKESYYTKVAESLSDWSGDYLITYTSGSEVLVLNSYSDTKGYGTDISSKVTSQGIHSNDGDQYKATVSKVGDGYSVNVANIGYIGLESSGNKVYKTTTTPSATDTKYQWTFSYKSGGSVWMTSVAYNNRRLQWNPSASCFRCYEGSQKELTFYRRDISTGGNSGGGNGGNTGGNDSGDGNEDDGGNTTPTPDPGQGEGNEGGNSGNEGGGSGEIPTPDPDNGGNIAGYLKCYDIPYVSANLPSGAGYSSKVSEKYGNTYAYIYETTNPNQRVVTHTVSNNGKVHRNYTFLYDYDKHCPIWLSYHMNSGYCGKGGSRTDAWGYDPAIPQSEQPNLSSSYSSGGKPYNRGHMIASHARSAIKVANQQAFYYTNMTPQLNATFNRGGGCWNDLEDSEMGILPSGRDTLYVVTGCIFEDGYKTISNAGDGLKCAVPDQFYKCFMLCSFDSNGKMTSAKAVGYLMPHDSPLNSGYSKYAKTIDAIESVAGFDFFTNVPSDLQTAAEAKITSIGL